MSNYPSYNSINLYTHSSVPPIYENPTITNMPTTPSYHFANYQAQSGIGAQPLTYRDPYITNYMEFPNFAGYQAQVGTNTQPYSNPCTTNYLGLDFRSPGQLTAYVATTDTNFEEHQVPFLVPRATVLSDNLDQAQQRPAPYYPQYPAPLDNIHSPQNSSTSLNDYNQTNPFDAVYSFL